MAGRFALTLAILFMAWIAFAGSVATEELYAGIVISFIVTVFVFRNFIKGGVLSKLNPLRWAYFLMFLADLFFKEIIAHLKVMALIIHPKIEPEIMTIKSRLKNPAGLTALANSITMTPGTLTVDVSGSELTVHCITKMQKEKICASSEKFLRGVSE